MESFEGLRRGFRALYRNRELNLGQALTALEAQEGLAPEVLNLVAFIRASERGIVS